MATISITIPDEKLQRVVSGVCLYHGYKAKLMLPLGGIIDNPESKGAFAKRMLIEQVKNWVMKAEADASFAAQHDLAEKEVNIT
jgi:hypothetical protein